MDRIKYLLLRFLREEATPAEQAELASWLAEAPANRALLEELQDPALVAEALAKLDQLHRQEAWAKVESYAAEHRPAVGTTDDPAGNQRTPRLRPKTLILRWSVAAAAIGIVAGAVLLLPKAQKNQPPAIATTTPAHDALPGGNKATLTLAGGKTIILDSASNGLLAEQGTTAIQKYKNGQISYVPSAASDQKAADEVKFNTLTTPRGGQYQLTLPDGTQVWLNAASRITYPTAFTEGERIVKITGEAYFEVAKDPGHGFRVITPTAAVQDIGTSFNVNSYTDEVNVVTTVLTGKVRFIQGVNQHPQIPSVTILSAGEQAKMDPRGDISGVDHPDLARALAWKNGLFAFSNADLPTVMRQLSRWYNVDVKYEGNIPKDQFQFNGKIGKTLTLDQVLKILTKTQVHYTIEGNQLTVRP